MTLQSSSQSRAWTAGEVKERLPEIPHLAETEGLQRIVAQRTLISATTEPFEIDAMAELLRMDAAHNPVLADYWGDDSNDDLIATP